MKMFIAGLVIGASWRQIKWLTYDLIKAFVRGLYRAFWLACIGPLKPGYTRWDAVKWLPIIIPTKVGTFITWEWWHGCKID